MATILAHAQTGALPLIGFWIESALAMAYVSAARRPSPRGRRWPAHRTAAFVAAMALMALTLQIGLAWFDERLWVHAVQHVVLMMVVPPLIALSSPVTLLLRSLSPGRRTAVVRVLHDPALSPATGRLGRWLVPIDYYATMVLYFATGWYGFSERHAFVHEATHVYFLVCGVLFWLPLAGVDPVRARPSALGRRLIVLVGAPISLALGLLVMVSPPEQVSQHAARAGGWALILAAGAATALGLVLVSRRSRTHRGLRPRSLPGATNPIAVR